jgi:hypothetical protein
MVICDRLLAAEQRRCGFRFPTDVFVVNSDGRVVIDHSDPESGEPFRVEFPEGPGATPLISSPTTFGAWM